VPRFVARYRQRTVGGLRPLSAIDRHRQRLRPVGGCLLRLLGIPLQEAAQPRHDFLFVDRAEPRLFVAGPHSFSVQRHAAGCAPGVSWLHHDGQQRFRPIDDGQSKPEAAALVPFLSLAGGGDLRAAAEHEAPVPGPCPDVFLLFVGKILPDAPRSDRQDHQAAALLSIPGAGSCHSNRSGGPLDALRPWPQGSLRPGDPDVQAALPLRPGFCSRLLGRECLGRLQVSGPRLSRRCAPPGSEAEALPPEDREPAGGVEPPGAVPAVLCVVAGGLDHSRPANGLALADEQKTDRSRGLRLILLLHARLPRPRKGHHDSDNTADAAGRAKPPKVVLQRPILVRRSLGIAGTLPSLVSPRRVHPQGELLFVLHGPGILHVADAPALDGRRAGRHLGDGGLRHRFAGRRSDTREVGIFPAHGHVRFRRVRPHGLLGDLLLSSRAIRSQVIRKTPEYTSNNKSKRLSREIDPIYVLYCLELNSNLLSRQSIYGVGCTRKFLKPFGIEWRNKVLESWREVVFYLSTFQKASIAFAAKPVAFGDSAKANTLDVVCFFTSITNQ